MPLPRAVLLKFYPQRICLIKFFEFFFAQNLIKFIWVVFNLEIICLPCDDFVLATMRTDFNSNLMFSLYHFFVMLPFI